eukprot:TRINITY_DN10273_c0_g1_i8.p3 TRINITY_DN10273_c0_g1~~TRINITY_DN10273_c0_g1_i8.p3  ORF type:complete len:103 (+),score=14.45 TRINITY_DN10273_c0_g1_i8:570-878(+)
MAKYEVVRDLIFMQANVLVLALIFASGSVGWYKGLFFILLYAGYIAWILLDSKKRMGSVQEIYEKRPLPLYLPRDFKRLVVSCLYWSRAEGKAKLKEMYYHH